MITKQGDATFSSRQVDDLLIATKSQATAESITKRTREHVKFDHEKELPITFVGTVEDCDGGDTSQFKDSITLSSERCIERMLKNHGWERESPNVESTCKAGETDGHLVSPPPADCPFKSFNETGPEEGTVEHATLEKKQGFECGALSGKPMCALATTKTDIAHADTTVSEFAGAPLEQHHKPLKGMAECLTISESWGVKFT